MLTEKQLEKLKGEIVLNSLFVSDYKNSLGIDKNRCCDFFEGYVEYLSGITAEENRKFSNPAEWFDTVIKHDTLDNLLSWYGCFEENPLPIGK